MQIIRYPPETCNIADPKLRKLIEKTIADLSVDYPYDPDELGFFLIVEPKIDKLPDINEKLGFDILANRWTGIRFDQPGYTQSFEVLEEQAGYYDMLFIISDSGFGIDVFIPKAEGVPADLLAMCRRYAVPAPTARV